VFRLFRFLRKRKALSGSIEQIQDYFRTNYGVEVKIALFVHNTGPNAAKMVREFAGWLADQVQAEIGGYESEWRGEKYAGFGVIADGVEFQAFYPVCQHPDNAEDKQ